MIGYLRSMLVATFAAGVVLAGPTASVRADVRDNASFFSKETVTKADDLIRDIRTDTTKDVIVETFAEAPADRRAGLKGDRWREEMKTWAAERAKELKANGVYVLICKNPSKLWVDVGPETREKAFTYANVDKLTEVFVEHFKKKDFDSGLIAGLRFIQDQMKQNLKGVKITPAAGSDYIRDQAKYFSDNARRKANDIIADIHKRWSKDVIIETFMKKPADEANVGDWARRRAQERHANGVYILMSRDPRDLRIDAGLETRKKAFTLADTERLHELMGADFKKERFDEGLVSGMEFIRDTMKKNMGSSAAPSPSAGPISTNTHRGGTPMGGGIPWMGLLCAGLVIIGVLWLVIGLVRAFTSRGSYGAGPGGPGGGGYGPGYGGGGGGGGGFMTGLMGGLFGAVAGSWLYNQFSGSHGSNFGSSTAYGSSSSTPTGTDDGGTLRSDDGRDFAGTGGDYGSDSGGGSGGDYGGDAGGDYGGDSGGSGGDYGGDSGGGGDYGGGGGDFGGGGGDFGGGGGDFGGGGGDF